MSINDYVNLNETESKVSEAIQPFIIHVLEEDVLVPQLSMAFLTIVESYSAYDQQFTRIMNIIQHSLIDFKDKPYK